MPKIRKLKEIASIVNQNPENISIQKVNKHQYSTALICYIDAV